MAGIDTPAQRPVTRSRAHHQSASSREEPFSLAERMDRTEEAVERMQEAVEGVDTRMEELEGDMEGLRSELQGGLNEGLDRLSEEASARDDTLEAMIVALRREVEELKEELERCKTAVGRGVLASIPTTKVDVPNPKEFKGTRSAKEVDNFLWGMEQYLRASNITDEATKVSTASMYLVDIALLWWRRRAAATPIIETWEDFKREFKSQFYPEYAEDEARAKLRRLTQRGTVREYVREFGELMLQISDLDMKEAKFMFLDGLKPWARQELLRRGVEDLNRAMTVAESLIELKRPEKAHMPEEGPNGEESSEEDEVSEGGSSRSSSRRRVSSRRNGDKEQKPLACFICEGPHRMRDCPNRSNLSAIAKEEPQPDDGPRVRYLGAITLSSGPRRRNKALTSEDERSNEDVQAPLDAQEVLEGSGDERPKELPPRSPPEREVDHEDELVREAHSSKREVTREVELVHEAHPPERKVERGVELVCGAQPSTEATIETMSLEEAGEEKAQEQSEAQTSMREA